MHGLMVFFLGFFLQSGFSSSFKDLKRASTLIMIMGFFSIYCGFIYNQFFSISFITQVGCFDPKTMKRDGQSNCHPFGLDWIWSIAGNAVPFLNSFKMKFSIIIGVMQMLLGLVLKLSNSIFFKNYIDLFFEAIPQLLFMLSTFGYLCVCIIIKWTSPYIPGKDVSILSIFINYPKVGTELFGLSGSQQKLQIALLVIALVSIVWMYLPKPLINYFRQKGIIRYRESVSEPNSSHSGERSILSVN